MFFNALVLLIFCANEETHLLKVTGKLLILQGYPHGYVDLKNVKQQLVKTSQNL